jgi:hypothetical protein
MADNRIKSVFGAYAERLQALVDERALKFKPTFFQNYLDWDTAQASLTYSMAIGRSRIEAAASVIARNSAAPVRSRATLDKYNGEVAAIEVSRNMQEDDYRNYLTVQAMSADSDAKKVQILKLIWDDVEYVRNAVMKRIDIMFCQAISTGTVILDGTTNPDGLNTTAIDLLMPSTNKKAATTAGGGGVVWSVANKATAKPITDIITITKAGEEAGISFAKILMPKALFYIFQQITEVQDFIKGFIRLDKGSIVPTLDQINTFLTANMLPTIEIVDVVTAIESDGVPTVLRPFKASSVSFIPDGKLGVIKNAIGIEELRPVESVVYAKSNNVLISKWASNNPFNEWTKGSLNAFPAISSIDSIYILDTNA